MLGAAMKRAEISPGKIQGTQVKGEIN